jgi:hypothetical protein
MTGTDIALHDQITYAKALAVSNLLPEAYRGKPENVLVAMAAAESLGITPFQAIQGIDVIKGKMSMSAQLMRALVANAGHHLVVDVLSDQGCRLLASRRETPDLVQAFEYSMADAQRAGLATSDNYKRHPKSMLLARCTSLACKAVFSDVLAGLTVGDEEQADVEEPRRRDTSSLLPKAPEVVVEQVMPTDVPGVVVDEDGVMRLEDDEA